MYVYTVQYVGQTSDTEQYINIYSKKQLLFTLYRVCTVLFSRYINDYLRYPGKDYIYIRRRWGGGGRGAEGEEDGGGGWGRGVLGGR